MDGNQPANSDGSWRFEPGETVSPRTAEPVPQTQPAPQAQPVPQQPAQPAPSQPQPQTQQPAQPVASVQQQPTVEVMAPRSVASPPTGPDGAISWTASEFIAHQKNGGWYGVLALVTLMAAVVVFILTKDKITTVMIIVVGLAFGAIARRQPRELSYRLDQNGLTIESRQYSYGTFRSFAIMTEGAFSSIVFAPLKRFAPLITIYYDPRDEAKIVDLLSERLPLEDRKQDPVDRLMWRIRF